MAYSSFHILSLGLLVNLGLIRFLLFWFDIFLSSKINSKVQALPFFYLGQTYKIKLFSLWNLKLERIKLAFIYFHLILAPFLKTQNGMFSILFKSNINWYFTWIVFLEKQLRSNGRKVPLIAVFQHYSQLAKLQTQHMDTHG